MSRIKPWEYVEVDVEGFAIREAGTNPSVPGDDGGIVGTSEWMWLEKDDAMLILAAPAYAKAWGMVPSEIKRQIFDSLNSPEYGWIEEAIAKATQVTVELPAERADAPNNQGEKT